MASNQRESRPFLLLHPSRWKRVMQKKPAWCLLLVSLMLAPPTGRAASSVRISFLDDPAVLLDTLQLMRNSGCADEGIAVFQRAVERYLATPSELELSRFSRRQDGFHVFQSIAALTSALPHPLCDTPHPYEWNCFDNVIVLTGGSLSTSVRPGQLTGPLLVPHTATNGAFSLVPAATPRDAFTFVYPSWYREATERLWPELQRDRRVVLTAALFSAHLLPQGTTGESLKRELMETLRTDWRRLDVRFPPRFELVLCHEVNLPQFWLVTVHAGLLFPRQGGFSYVEKAGGKGPFVRLDFDDRAALWEWLGAMFRGGEKLGYTHHFATLNDARVERLDTVKK